MAPAGGAGGRARRLQGHCGKRVPGGRGRTLPAAPPVEAGVRCPGRHRPRLRDFRANGSRRTAPAAGSPSRLPTPIGSGPACPWPCTGDAFGTQAEGCAPLPRDAVGEPVTTDTAPGPPGGGGSASSSGRACRRVGTAPPPPRAVPAAGTAPGPRSSVRAWLTWKTSAGKG